MEPKLGVQINHAIYGLGLIVYSDWEGDVFLVRFSKTHSDLHDGRSTGHFYAKDTCYWFGKFRLEDETLITTRRAKCQQQLLEKTV
jgi:hypothetical protein